MRKVTTNKSSRKGASGRFVNRTRDGGHAVGRSEKASGRFLATLGRGDEVASATGGGPVRFERRGREHVVVLTRAHYRQLVDASRRADPIPALPPEGPGGTMPALEFARATIARGIIADRQALGWSQAELARQANIRVETLNKIERARVTPDAATLRKIDAAIARAGKSRIRGATAAR